MKNAYELLEQKEADLARVRREIESLRLVSTLLSDNDAGESDPTRKRDSSTEKTLDPQPESQATGTDGISSPPSKRNIWSVLKGAK
jgi:hypothetical protein